MSPPLLIVAPQQQPLQRSRCGAQSRTWSKRDRGFVRCGLCRFAPIVAGRAGSLRMRDAHRCDETGSRTPVASVASTRRGGGRGDECCRHRDHGVLPAASDRLCLLHAEVAPSPQHAAKDLHRHAPSVDESCSNSRSPRSAAVQRLGRLPCSSSTHGGVHPMWRATGAEGSSRKRCAVLALPCCRYTESRATGHTRAARRARRSRGARGRRGIDK